MSHKVYGFVSGDIIIPPYLTRKEVWMDCADGVIPNLYRRDTHGNSRYIVFRDHIEDYYRSKKLPEFLIEMKLAELKILSKKQKAEMEAFKKNNQSLQKPSIMVG